MREILLLSKRLIKAKEFERIALTNNINFEDLKDGYVKLYNSSIFTIFCFHIIAVDFSINRSHHVANNLASIYCHNPISSSSSL